MSVRGRKPRPDALKFKEGVRADRINLDALEGLPGLPECPEHLDDDGAAEWGRMTALLDELGVLTRTDGQALAIYCETFSRWMQARRDIATYGITVESATGSLKTNPAVKVASACETQMARLLAEFGCTPSSRSRLKAGKKKKSRLDKFLERKPA